MEACAGDCIIKPQIGMEIDQAAAATSTSSQLPQDGSLEVLAGGAIEDHGFVPLTCLQ